MGYLRDSDNNYILDANGLPVGDNSPSIITCQTIIGRAFRKLNAFKPSAIPDSNRDEAMYVLQSIYMECVGAGFFGRVNDLIATGEWTACPQQRVRLDNSDIQVTIPNALPNWWGWPGYYSWWWPVWPINPANCARPPRDLSVVTLVNSELSNQAVNIGLAYTFIYDAYVGKWWPLDSLLVTDEAPLSRRWAEPLANVLAERLDPEYGDQGFQAPRNAGMDIIASRWGSESHSVIAEYC